MGSQNSLRTRWAAIGAACAVTLGGGTIGVVRAVQSTGERATYVAVTPVRVLDTRTDVGAADIVDATPVLLTVTGNIATTTGNATVVPVGATGVVVNVTAVNPSVGGFVSLRPGNAVGAPSVSTLNVTANGIFPNGATLTLPTSGPSAGQVQIWFEGDGTGGRTDMLIDVVGYYVDHNHDDRYYTKTESDTALSSKLDETDLVPYPMTPSYIYKDQTPGTGEYPSITTLADGHTFSTFYYRNSGDLRYLYCVDEICSSVLGGTVDSTGNVGSMSAVVTGVDGFPTIAYFDQTNTALKVADCSNVLCSGPTVTTIDSIGTVGGFPSITINNAGNPVIAYFDETNTALKMATCANATCTSSQTVTVDNTDQTGYSTSIAIGANGLPIIAHYSVSAQAVRVAACRDAGCTTSTVTTMTRNGAVVDAGTPSIAIGSDGLPMISMSDSSVAGGGLSVARCADSTCATHDIVTVDSSLGLYTSLKVPPNGLPLIASYNNQGSALRLTACSDPHCDTSMSMTIDNEADVGEMATMTIGSDGFPVIGYHDYTNSNFRLVRVALAMVASPFIS